MHGIPPEIPASVLESFKVSQRALVRLTCLMYPLITGLISHPDGHPAIRSWAAGHPESSGVLSVMLQAQESSTRTLIDLSAGPGPHSRDCFGISRSIVELAINSCYILAEGETAAQKARRHAEQKSVRDMNRESQVGQHTIRVSMSRERPQSAPVELKNALEEFTARSGREKGWTDLSVDARCARAGEVFGSRVLSALHSARFGVYRHSSEVLHGTFFGAVWFMGLTSPSARTKGMDRAVGHIAGAHLLSLVCVALAFRAVVIALDSVAGIESVKSEMQDAFDELNTAPYFLERGADAEGS